MARNPANLQDTGAHGTKTPGAHGTNPKEQLAQRRDCEKREGEGLKEIFLQLHTLKWKCIGVCIWEFKLGIKMERKVE